ncbi:MAG: hypothetical protein ABR923_21685 [Terracidiphilus sp.]
MASVSPTSAQPALLRIGCREDTPTGKYLTSTAQDGTTTSYTYDALNRLTGRSSNSPHAVGNRGT